MLKAIVHPCWTGEPEYGFDYGIGILGYEEDGDIELSAEEINDDYFLAEVKERTRDILEDSMGHVAGYPGDWGDTMCEMSGIFKRFGKKTAGSFTGRTVIFDIDISGGNAGGPIWCTDPNTVERLMDERGFAMDGDDDRCLIGVVAGTYDGDNLGTLITPDIYQWTVMKLVENLDIAGMNIKVQKGNITKPRPGTGGSEWRPRFEIEEEGVKYEYEDIQAVYKRGCSEENMKYYVTMKNT